MNNHPEKSNWASRAKHNLDRTLGFIKVYAPKVLKAGAQLSLLGFAGAMMVTQIVPDASLASQIAGGAASTFLQLKEMYASLTEQVSALDDSKSLTVDEEAQRLRQELAEARQLVEELSNTVTVQQSTIETMSRAMVMINTSHNTLMDSHTQMRDALGQAHREMNAQAYRKGEISYVPYDPEKDNFARMESEAENPDVMDEPEDVTPGL